MYLSGVVIPDLDDDENVVIASADYEQVYLPQQYGDDGILDGAEGFGVMQARALKARLTRGRASRRRLSMGRRGLTIIGTSPLYDGFGVAPLAIAAAAFKPVSRIFKTPAHKRAAKEAPQYKARALAGDAFALSELERNTRQAATAKARAVWKKFYDQTVAELRARGTPVVATPGVTPVTGPTPIVQPQPSVPSPVVGPVHDAAGGVAPMLPPAPSPIPAGAGGPATASEAVAAAAQNGSTVEVAQAGMLGGLDMKSLMPLMLIGVGALVLSKVTGGGGGSRRRRR